MGRTASATRWFARPSADISCHHWPCVDRDRSGGGRRLVHRGQWPASRTAAARDDRRCRARLPGRARRGPDHDGDAPIRGAHARGLDVGQTSWPPRRVTRALRAFDMHHSIAIVGRHISIGGLLSTNLTDLQKKDRALFEPRRGSAPKGPSDFVARRFSAQPPRIETEKPESGG